MEPTASGSPTTTLHHAPGPVSWFLVVDHVRLDALLQRAGAQPGAIDHATYAEFRAGLLKHIGMEEKILLPAAQRARGDEPLRPPPPGCGSIQKRLRRFREGVPRPPCNKVQWTGASAL